MAKDLFRYDRMVETALRGVVRDALKRAAASGLPGAHHFYITFRTGGRGVEIPSYLTERYPSEMTIVLEHQYWDLEVTEDGFAVTLSFQNRPERLKIPFAAIAGFADPSVEFGLQFQDLDGADVEPIASARQPGKARAVEATATAAAKPPEPAPTAKTTEANEEPARKPGEVVPLDAFRKK